jgi:hypothetical protein
MANIFEQVQMDKPTRNVFNLSHEKKLSCDMGELVPIFCEETVPGDKFRIKSEAIIRMAPMIAPVMHRVNVYMHYFFVPNRLVWDDWEKFITGGPDGNALPTMPTVGFSQSAWELIKSGSLADYMGVPSPTGSIGNTYFNALPFRAYQLIYNDYYRDQDLEPEIDISKSSGVDPYSAEMVLLRNRCWEKDYFTSARPTPQKGGEVEIPLLGAAPVERNLDSNTSWNVYESGSGNPASAGDIGTASGAYLQNSGVAIGLNPNDTLQADLSTVGATTIEDLRNAVRTQEWKEKNMRGGSRYIEQMKSHFGVVSSDARLQRPEYLCGGKVPMSISEVLQTSESATSPQANMAGHGVSAGQMPTCTMFAEEHGYIIGIMSVMPKTAYQQGFRRHLLKDDKFDYFWPTFENIGEQPVYNAELYHDFASAVDKDTFAYQSRYSEYKSIPNSSHGDFKGNLNFWHMNRIFNSLPALNADFVKADPTTRIFAVETTDDHLWCMVYNDVKAIRPMRRFATPKL